MTALTFMLPDDTILALRERMASGNYADENAVVSEAIRQMEERSYEVRLQKLREAIAPGLRQALNGECRPYSIEDLDRDMAAKS